MSDAATRTSDSTDLPEDASPEPGELSGHAGELAVAVARAHGVQTMFTLSGAHVFPLYDGAVKAAERAEGGGAIRLRDVRGMRVSGSRGLPEVQLNRVADGRIP